MGEPPLGRTLLGRELRSPQSPDSVIDFCPVKVALVCGLCDRCSHHVATWPGEILKGLSDSRRAVGHDPGPKEIAMNPQRYT